MLNGDIFGDNIMVMDVITKVDTKPVNSCKGFIQLIDSCDGRDNCNNQLILSTNLVYKPS